jgi:16S rRNA (guanine527-N7)-methyltransferase
VSELWNTLAARANVTLSPAQHAQLNRYLDLLSEANQRMNLTRITDRASAELHHIGDSLTLLPFLPPQAGAERTRVATDEFPARIVDVGTGAGLPGVILAVARPDLEITLIESTKKKAAFLSSTISALNLTNVTIKAERAEAVAHTNLRETFDIAVARAVATLDFLAEWCLPLVKVHGKFLAMKGEKIHAELPLAKRAIKLLGGGEALIHPVDLPETHHHVIVEIPKLSRTPKTFPRPATQAKGKPL